MNDRTASLKERMMAIEPEICPERAVLLTESWRETAGQPVPIRRAKGFAHILKNMSICIQPGELIVGNLAGEQRAAPIFPEYAVAWIKAELDDFSGRPIDRFDVSAEARSALLDVCEFWQGETFHDRVEWLIQNSLPDNMRSAFDVSGSCLNEAVGNIGKVTTGDGHVIANYERVLQTGLLEPIKEARGHLRRLDMTRPENLEKRLFYESVIGSLKAAIDFARRFADLANRLAKDEKDERRRTELKTIARVCRRVPANPAADFWEALQSYWFIHLLIHIESNGHSISPGRFDQYLHSFYIGDVAAGSLDSRQALELVECFWIKCNELNKVRSWAFTQHMSGYPMFQTVTLGGQTQEGLDATNDLTYICLEATKNLKLPQPTAIVRVHDGSPEAFLVAAAECLVSHGGGMPGFFNDETAIPLLMRLGVTLEEARDWCVMGCSEPQVAGKFCTGTGGASYVNLLKVLEIALNGGVNPTTGECPCPDDISLGNFSSIEDMRDAFNRQLAFYLQVVPILDNATSLTFTELTPTPFLSGIIDNRIEIGKDIAAGGPPNYHNIVFHAYGLANVANSLAAMKTLIFDQKAISAEQLAEAMRENFMTPEGSRLRQMLINRAPKYGNDEEEVDGFARDVIRTLATEISRYTPARGGFIGPSTQSLTANVPAGKRVGATPDGRLSGAPLADNNSPSPGTDVSGPTAVLGSVAKFDHALMSNGTILNIKLHPTALDGEKGLHKFTAMIRTFFDLKGFQVQFNVISEETLLDAQAHPENHPNLVVKVAGYSALFSTLDRKLQDQIIARTVHHV